LYSKSEIQVSYTFQIPIFNAILGRDFDYLLYFEQKVEKANLHFIERSKNLVSS